MQMVATCIWFDHEAEEAARFYTSLFPNSKITGVTHYGEAGPGPKGSVLTVTFQLDGADFIGLNGGPVFPLTPAVSLSIQCWNQEEVDRYWEQLSEGGQKSRCGWVTDRYGLSWQIVPVALQEMLNAGEPEKADRAMRAMLQMTKLDIATLQKAYDGG